jgi:hypothetical protein
MISAERIKEFPRLRLYQSKPTQEVFREQEVLAAIKSFS